MRSKFVYLAWQLKVWELQHTPWSRTIYVFVCPRCVTSSPRRDVKTTHLWPLRELSLSTVLTVRSINFWKIHILLGYRQTRFHVHILFRSAFCPLKMWCLGEEYALLPPTRQPSAEMAHTPCHFRLPKAVACFSCFPRGQHQPFRVRAGEARPLVWPVCVNRCHLGSLPGDFQLSEHINSYTDC